MSRTIGPAIAVIIGGLLMPTASAQEFRQDRFAIGFWVDPPADENVEQHYLDIANANFTLVLGSFGARTPVHVERQLELCER